MDTLGIQGISPKTNFQKGKFHQSKSYAPGELDLFEKINPNRFGEDGEGSLFLGIFGLHLQTSDFGFTPRKSNMEPEVMMVWKMMFRLPGVYSQVPC